MTAGKSAHPRGAETERKFYRETKNQSDDEKKKKPKPSMEFDRHASWNYSCTHQNTNVCSFLIKRVTVSSRGRRTQPQLP